MYSTLFLTTDFYKVTTRTMKFLNPESYKIVNKQTYFQCGKISENFVGRGISSYSILVLNNTSFSKSYFLFLFLSLFILVSKSRANFTILMGLRANDIV